MFKCIHRASAAKDPAMQNM